MIAFMRTLLHDGTGQRPLSGTAHGTTGQGCSRVQRRRRARVGESECPVRLSIATDAPRCPLGRATALPDTGTRARRSSARGAGPAHPAHRRSCLRPDEELTPPAPYGLLLDGTFVMPNVAHPVGQERSARATAQVSVAQGSDRTPSGQPVPAQCGAWNGRCRSPDVRQHQEGASRCCSGLLQPADSSPSSRAAVGSRELLNPPACGGTAVPESKPGTDFGI